MELPENPYKVGDLVRQTARSAYESDCPAWKCPHISVHDWREGRRCAEHPCTCPESTVQEQPHD